MHLGCAFGLCIGGACWANEWDSIAGVGDKDALQSCAFAKQFPVQCNLVQRRDVKDFVIHQNFKDVFVSFDPALSQCSTLTFSQSIAFFELPILHFYPIGDRYLGKSSKKTRIFYGQADCKG